MTFDFTVKKKSRIYFLPLTTLQEIRLMQLLAIANTPIDLHM